MLFHLTKPDFGVRHLACALASLSLAACSGASSLRDGAAGSNGLSQAISSHEAAALYNEQTEIPATMAVVRIGNRTSGILSATQRTYQNGFSQRVVYPMTSRGQSENYIDSRIAVRRLVRKRSDKLSLHSTRSSNIIADAARSLPVSQKDLNQQDIYRNAYGPYGMLFVKSANKVNCLFGWQTLTDESSSLSDSNGLSGAAKWPSRQGLSYRLRYCEEGLQKADAQNLMEQIELQPEFGRIWQSGDVVSLAPIAVAKTVTKKATAQATSTRVRKKKVVLPPEQVNRTIAHAVPHPEADHTLTTGSIAVPEPDGAAAQTQTMARSEITQSTVLVGSTAASTPYLVPVP